MHSYSSTKALPSLPQYYQWWGKPDSTGRPPIRVRVQISDAEARRIIGKTELVKGLGTRCPKEAQRLGAGYVASFLQQISDVRGLKLVPYVIPARPLTQSLVQDAIAMERDNGIARTELLRRLDNAYGERTVMIPAAEAAEIPMAGYTRQAAIADWVASYGDTPPQATTVDIYTAHLERFMAWVGSDELNTVTEQHILDYPNVLLTGSDGERRVSNKTVNNHMGSIRKIFRSSKRAKKITADPTVGNIAKLNTKKNAAEKRQPFSREMAAEIFTKAGESNDPIIRFGWQIGLTMGCRVGELADATVSAVRQIGKVWCLDINEKYRGWHVNRLTGKRERLSLKTDSSPRIVPLHSTVLAGFLAYLEGINTDADAPLFPHLTKLNQDGERGYEASTKLNEWLDANVIDDPRFVVHSCRHSVNDWLEGECSDRTRLKILGHSNGSVNENYGLGEIHKMQNAIESIRPNSPEWIEAA